MPRPIASYLDHSVLNPLQTEKDLRAACELCDRVGTASICVKPSYVPLTAKLLSASQVAVSTVIGFPHGGTSTAAKCREAEVACQEGARELDMVVNLGRVAERDWSYVEKEIAQIVAIAHRSEAITKVIFESGLLEDELKIALCGVCERAGAEYVKTSTGFGYVKRADGGMEATGATEHDVQLMRTHCGPNVGVKASGGIRTIQHALRFIELGATRLGTSSTEALVEQEAGTSTAKRSPASAESY